jgi:hypothetical protein
MAKKTSDSKDRPGRIEIQKGPISMDEQFCSGFRREPQMTNEDLKWNEDRRAGHILTKHEPKR